MPSNQDPMYQIVNSQNGLFPNMLSPHNLEFIPDVDPTKHQHSSTTKPSGYDSTFRSFSSYSNSVRQRNHPAPSVPHPSQIRDNYYPNSADVYGMTSPVQSHSTPTFDPASGHGPHSFKTFHDPFGHANVNLQSSQMLAGMNGKSNVTQTMAPNKAYNPAPYHPGVQFTSQTPYGPHIPINPSSHMPNGMNNVPGAPAPQNVSVSNPTTVTSGNPPASNQEEICTIFVVGFPDDMQEREFQNMFTFSPGFEAATLKIPNKDNTTYGNNSGRSYGGSNDPYNLVTVNQGGVVVDGGRDGTMSSWPTSVPGDESSGTGQFGNNGNAPPRKQIIGFAKFRTRPDALAAREVLQGKRIDMEKGAVLKAEMAKKNLHTKRGVGSVPNNNAVPSVTLGGASAIAGLGSNFGVFQQSIGINNAPDIYGMTGPDSVGATNGVGLNRINQWKEAPHTLIHEPSLTPLREREEDELRRRESSANAMNIGTLPVRGLRDRVDEEELERRRKEKELRSRIGVGSFDPFSNFSHSYSDSFRQSTSMNGTNNGLLCSMEASHAVHGVVPQQDEEVGPWDNVRIYGPQSSVQHTRPPSQRSASPSNPSHPPGLDGKMLPMERQTSSDSTSSSLATGSRNDGVDGRSSSTINGEVAKSMGGLSLSTNNGNTSPQLPSPASNTSSAGTRSIDQNPPINTLYVGNLPTSPSPNGCSSEQLEEKLRELFSAQPGFRRLCFRQKSNGPMCFVEFEDVHYATKALNDLHGHTLNGLVKGAGIRLSYSKNPLGVRTPTSAGGGQLQQSQLNGNSQFSMDALHHRLGDDPLQTKPSIMRREVNPTSPPVPNVGTHGPFGNSFLASPPPRFFSSSPASPQFNTSATPGSGTVFPRNTSANVLNLYNPPTSFAPFGFSTSASQLMIPDNITSLDEQNSANSHNVQQHFSHRAISPPAANLEAARAG
ncbi:hypothetical protein AX17_002164 [Amanita inopinata Kibby_2008]|nr:hypothetical protein AX17_002164 [Amanita inopinata Kibby_2008]